MSARPIRVAHVTTVHPRDDIRIFHKECVSLAQAGYEVIQVVSDGLGDAKVAGVHITDIGAPVEGRLRRMRTLPRRAYAAVRRLDPALVHFHDPELLPLGVAFARSGTASVYDAHEDVPRQILTKQWIPPVFRKVASWSFERFEDRQVRELSAVVAATPRIAQRFASVSQRCVNVSNFPLLAELAPPTAAPTRERAVCYVGGLTRLRGIRELVRAVALLPDVRLILCGNFEDAAFETEMRAEPGWARVEYRGRVGRTEIREVLARSSAGLVTLLPMPSYIDSLPIKMFEYMSAELPVIASDFPLWRDIVESSGCGLCVDPTDPSAVAAAIRSLLDDPRQAQALGAAGRKAVLSTYNWPQAERALLALYSELLR